MDDGVKNMWIDALVSGEYTQCIGTLRVKEEDKEAYRHCALGVLCDLYIKKNSYEDVWWAKEDDPGHIFYIYDDGREDRAEGDLPLNVRDWIDAATEAGPLFTVGTAKKVLNKSDKFWEDTLKGVHESVLEGPRNEAWINIARLNDAGASFEDIAQVLRILH